MKKSIAAQYLFEAVSDQRRFWITARKSPRTAPFRKLHIQCAWNSRRSARHWAKQVEMTIEQVHAEAVASATVSLAARVEFWRGSCGLTEQQVIANVHAWQDMAYPDSVRRVAIASVIDIFFA